MGSDFSYEDSTERLKLKERYTPYLIGTDIIEGKEVYLLELISLEEGVSYYRRKIWVAQEEYVILRQEMYAKSGKLLKIAKTLAVEEVNNRFYPSHLVMTDQLRKDSSTEIILSDLRLDEEIPNQIFTRQYLEQKK